jgi:diaminopimelate epimerase
MKIKFYKYQGTGNDFILIDHRTPFFDRENTQLIAQLCDRRFGIGADGFMLLESEPGYDFKMVYYNSDGNTSSMCGNGGRCIVKFAHDLKIIGDKTKFIAVDGEHLAEVKGDWVHLNMIDVAQIEKGADYCYMNTGSPHFVKAVQNIMDVNVYEEGRKIRFNERFKEKGTNVNFIEKQDNELWVRTYERGVEDETFSCGTGVTAAALSVALEGWKSPVAIKTKGGDLSISYTRNTDGFANIYLNGPAEKVFEGEIEL